MTDYTREGWVVADRDQQPRPDTTMEGLRDLRTPFRPLGKVTAGNSSGLNDGACGVLVMAEDTAKALGIRPKMRLVAYSYADVLPKFLVEDSEPKLFVSRQKELGKLGIWLGKAVHSKGGVYFVVGEPGSGKTALLAEFSRRALQRYADLLVLWGQCNAYTGQGDPYFPFLNITRMLVGDIESHLSIGGLTLEHAQRLWKFLPETIASLMDFGPGLIDRFLMGNSRLDFAQMHRGIDPNMLAVLNSQLKGHPQGPGQLRLPQVALLEQFSRVVTTLSHSHPLVVILDDLQSDRPRFLESPFSSGWRGNR